MTGTERNAENATCLVLLQQIAAAADATVKLEPSEAATTLKTLAGAYTLLVDPPLSGDDVPLDETAHSLASSRP
ncbi:hypothetical protein ACIBQ5_32950 [Streptomyces massasporeus]|uniref:hypothetical protein n=1 Tax=Streptomyces massasporeus TaxID=67324 RepID=UPI0037A85036